MTRRALVASALALGTLTSIVSAQVGGKLVTGNPTPGVEQPAPPALADRVTLTGCLQPSPTRGPEPHDANTPSDARYVLGSAERVDRVPPGTGGSELAAKTTGRTYRLEGIDSQFSPFVGTTVEISGEVKTSPPSEAGASAAPTLLVAFIQKIARTCS